MCAQTWEQGPSLGTPSRISSAKTNLISSITAGSTRPRRGWTRPGAPVGPSQVRQTPRAVDVGLDVEDGGWQWGYCISVENLV